MKEIMFNDETIKVFKASGYHDGYYWDMNAKIEFRGETYSLYDAGSGSGYIPSCNGITKCEFDRLYGEEQGEIDEDDWFYFERTIYMLLDNFIRYGAEKSYESQEDDNYETHVLVDEVEVSYKDCEEA